MNNYFLIARNRKDNSFKIIGINEKWYLDSEGRDFEHFACSLEAIDLVTSKFRCREQLSQRLCDKGHIKSSDVDLFIASRSTVDGKDYIRFDEVIYNPNNSRRMSEFRHIADESLADSMDTMKAERDFISEELIMEVYSADDLYSIVMDGDTNISKKIVELLRDVPSYSDVPFELKREKALRKADYRTLRNIVETLNRFDLISKCSRDDRYLAHEAFVEENKSDRMALIPKLVFGLNIDYGAEQMGFDGVFSKDDEKRRKATKEIVRQEKEESFIPDAPSIPRIVVKDNVSIAKKKEEIFRVLRGLPTNAFKSVSNKYRVNYDLFGVPVYDDEKELLDTLLTGNLPKYFMNYAMHRRQFKEVFTYNQGSSELGEIRRSMECDLASIRKRFRSYKCVNDVYNWCMLWEGCMNRSSEFGNNSGKGECGKKYGKHK